MLRNSAIAAGELATRLKAAQTGAPAPLPFDWTASVLLSPFGDASPPMADYDQLVVAEIAYSYGANSQTMQIGLYLLESLTFFEFLFINGSAGGQWYWLVAPPGGPIDQYLGPFPTSLQVPSPAFLSESGAVYGNQWPIAGTMTNGWVVPTAPAPNIPPHGTWFSQRADNGFLWRVLNLDSNNPLNIPILGSYYFANITGFSLQAPGHLDAVVQGARTGGQKPAVTPPSPMVTQRDIQTAFASPLSSTPCQLSDIQAVIPGINPPPGPSMPLPQWTDQTFIQGWTIGCDFIPYYTEVWYWWSYKHQRSMFVGFGPNPGLSTYRDRQDTILYAGYTTSPIYYAVSEHLWEKVACNPCLPGVGIPRPDFVQADGGIIKGTVTGNAAFGLGPSQTMMLIGAPMDRGINPNSQAELSLFWFWFTDDQKGVLFSEGNYIDTVVSHELQVIDYEYFEQNAGDHVTDQSFPDPCFVPECTATKPAAAVRGAPLFLHASVRK